ncbi:MAG: hypothetical protein WC570_01425 [Patescibacteria group bacterium]
MLSTAHLVVGAAIGASGASYAEILFYSVIMHFLMDTLPHWDPDFTKNRRFFVIASVDMLVGLCLVFGLVGNDLNPKILIGMMFSILPDVITFFLLMWKTTFGQNYIEWHKMIQNRNNHWGGILSQLLVILLGGLLLII